MQFEGILENLKKKKKISTFSLLPHFFVSQTYSAARAHFKTSSQTLQNVPELRGAEQAERKKR